MIPSPTEAEQFLVNGSPVVIATQMPHVAPGSTPIAFGSWKAAYTVRAISSVTSRDQPAPVESNDKSSSPTLVRRSSLKLLGSARLTVRTDAEGVHQAAVVEIDNA